MVDLWLSRRWQGQTLGPKTLGLLLLALLLLGLLMWLLGVMGLLGPLLPLLLGLLLLGLMPQCQHSLGAVLLFRLLQFSHVSLTS
jgi:hypothetical protein